ncbi:MAG: serine hydrolase, partial [Pseudomonadota bacterium]
PFALQERNANCTHNGLLTFVIDRRGRPSNAVYQIGSETCAYFQYDMWGAASVDYTPGEIVEAEAIKAAYGRETSGRMPTKPIAALRDDHPGLDAAAFANPADVSPAALTAFGVVVDGVHYRGGCETRYGPYPFCAEIALPSYSVSKSVFAGLGLMRLEKLYPGVKNALIADHVPQCPERGWRDVTFENALDMATGRYRSTEREADENAAVQDGFFIVETHAEKIARACGMYPRKSAPGKTWVYHTTDHYVLGSAMQSFLREKAGGDADIHRDLIVEPIWHTLPLSPVAERTRRTRDDVGQPYVGWGLTFLPDDYAKLADFVNAGGGRVGGGSQVDAGMLAAAMQRAPDDAGLSAGGPAFRYNNGFWAWNAAGTAGCDGALWTPFMSGFGGVSVVLMRNGVSYYYVSDGGEYAWARAVAASARYREMC